MLFLIILAPVTALRIPKEFCNLKLREKDQINQQIRWSEIKNYINNDGVIPIKN